MNKYEAATDFRSVAKYLYSVKPTLSPLKLQKSLYFLYAYYGALYGNREKEYVFEGADEQMPPRLFNVEFEAWQYGPVIRDVYFENRRGEYSSEEAKSEGESVINESTELKAFIDELFSQIDQHSDFTLVERSHDDDAWKKAYESAEKIIDNDLLIKEYTEKYV